MSTTTKEHAMTTTTVRPNAYPGRCTSCGGHVAAQAGLLLGDRRSGYSVRHNGECPAKPASKRLPVEESGVYVLPDGRIVQVKANQQKTRTYTKLWVEIGGERLRDHDEVHVHGDYHYAPELMDEVASTGRRMTLDEAKAFILRYGRCCRCGRTLKAADSVERGIGPVCVTYFSGGTTGANLLAG